MLCVCLDVDVYCIYYREYWPHHCILDIETSFRSRDCSSFESQSRRFEVSSQSQEDSHESLITATIWLSKTYVNQRVFLCCICR